MKVTLLSPLLEDAGLAIADLLVKNQQLIIKVIIVVGIACFVAKNAFRVIWGINFSAMLLFKAFYRLIEYPVAWVLKLEE